jgi:putative two-component system response regulator
MLSAIPHKPLVQIVDDNPTNIDILVNALQEDYRLGISKNGARAMAYAAKHRPLLILLDIMMPDMNGYDVCRKLKESPRTSDIAVIFITAVNETSSKTKGFEIGAVDYITKPFNAAEVRARVQNHVNLRRMQEELNNQNRILQQKVEEKTALTQQILQLTIQSMSQMAESRDPYTAGHQQRVAQLACAIAGRMNMTAEEIDTIRVAGLLHDIGKFRIPTDILNRPGKILDVEYEFLKVHPTVAYDFLKDIPFPGPVSEIVYQHHEKLDGSGYPRGLSRDDILPEARILTVADVIEAMSSHRPYRPALGTDIALAEIVKHRGDQFDPEVVDACEAVFNEDAFQFL